MVMMVVVSGIEDLDILVYILGKMSWMFRQKCSAEVTKNSPVKGQTTSTLGLSTHPPGGTEETGGSQLGYATYLVDFWKSVGKVFSCQNDWEALLVKYSGIHGQTHTVMNFLVQNANDTLSPDTSMKDNSLSISQCSR